MSEAGLSPGPRAGTVVGHYEFVRRIGSGGMGEVYLARRADGQFEQTAALKLISIAAASHTERFLTERQILAALEHPNIAHLLDGGLADDGRPFMAMEFVEGPPLLSYCDEQALDLPTRLRLFLAVCEAVAYAHQNLVVHRDIKPSNIRMDGAGRPKLLDFGIALLLSDEGAGENTQALATPRYAAPEQLSGGRITTATDVYGLGALLYALLTGHPPLDLDDLSLPQVLDRLLHREPTPLSRVELAPDRPYRADELAGDLEAICAKALAKEPARRYRSAEALAEDLHRHLAGLPVSARAPTWSYRAGRHLRRNVWLVASASGLVLSLLVGLAGTAWQAHRASLERDIARAEAEHLNTLRTAVLQMFSSAAADADDGPLTARKLFANSAAKVDQEFGNDPATQGALLQMLGDLHLATEDYEAARPLLERALALREQGLQPAILARVHHGLAHLAFRDGNAASAQSHYDAAVGFWRTAADRYRAELVWSSTIASQLARSRGDSEAAIAILEQAAADADLAWGHEHPETGIVLINLAVAYYYANRLPDALQACAQAWAVWEAIGRTDSPDALNLLANWGLFAVRHGDLDIGEQRLSQALDLRSQLYGPSAALATLMKNLGTVHILNGRSEDGLALLEQAHDMADKFAGAGGRLHASAAYALGWALQSLGQTQRAAETLRAGVDAVGERSNLWTLMCQALLGWVEQQLGATDAVARLDSAIAALLATGAPGIPLRADALSFRAQGRGAAGDRAGAIADFQEALELKRQARGADHYEFLEIQSRLGQALAQDHERDAGMALMEQAAAALTRRLGAQHPLTTLAMQRLRSFDSD